MTKKRRLAVISDFHMDSNHFSQEEIDIFLSLLKDLKITDLHFAGDISNDFHGISEPLFKQIELLTELSVTYNLGNHDMVGLSEEEISVSNFQVKTFASTAFVSFHGWYDYSFMTGKIDIKKIIAFKNSFYFDRKIHRQFDDIKITNLELQKLEKLLTELSANPKFDRIIVSTHFVPHQQFIINTRYEKFARFNAYLGSQHFHETFKKFPKISDVIFGHLHQRRLPLTFDKVLYHAHPLGYPYEWQMINHFLEEYPQYQITENWHLRKRYNAIRKSSDWLKFRKAHLREEFLSALTIFDLDD
ncbi:metallophosphoesterase [Lactococcus lactis]|uniref:metallophosphoesterase n=1 Tax=Lactococcus lactis TaxID=1358 RepID=UPI00050D7ACE|nr:metallophosphoesterase [Lactococcus lactis]AIS03949.1 Phosphoesterase, calcineurin-like family [Lactococcus lactis]RHJ30356.1 phosphoesterase [Lactococcus lactis]